MKQDLLPPRHEWQALHPQDCSCPACEPYAPSAPSRLTAADLGKLAFAGAMVGNAIAFTIDPAGAARALLATIGL